MKLLEYTKYMLAAAGTAALLALGACSHEEPEKTEPEPEPEPEYGDSYWAARSFISCNSGSYTDTNLGGTIEFAAAGGEVVISVDCGTQWTVDTSSAGAFDASVNADDNTVTVTAGQNTGAETLSGTVTFITATDRVRFATVTISQDAAAWLTVSSHAMDFDHDGGKVTLTVESNYDWTFSTEGGSDWLTVSSKGSSLTGIAAVNDTGDDREASITLMAGDGAENVAEVTITVLQGPYDPSELVLIYEVVSDGTPIILPLGGTVDCTVDWGDGSDTETVTATYPSHTYAAGTYRVRISGTVTKLNGLNVDSVGKEALVAVRQWGLTGLTSVNSALRNCTNLSYIHGDTDGSFSAVTDFFQFLTGCTGLTELPEDLFAYAASGTDFQSCFFGCTGLTSIPEDLFAGCTAAQRFYMTFYGCTGLTAIPDGLFTHCPDVTTFAASFRGCSALTTVPEDLFAHNPNVTSFANAFYLCTGLESVPESLFSSCPEVGDFSWVFSYCTSLTDIPAGIFSGNTKVTDFSYAFYGCSGLACESPYDSVASGGQTVRVHLYERTAALGYTVPDTFGSCFRDCTSLTDYSSIPSDWK